MKKTGIILEGRAWAGAAAIASLLIAAVSLIASCAPQTKTSSLPLDPPETFSASGTREIPDRWWTAFDDPGVVLLVDRALAANFNLKTAWQRLREARAIVDRESSALFPDLDVFSEAEGSISESDDDDEGLRLGLTSAYEIDLWGRIQSAVEAEQYLSRATFADYQTAALSLSAEVVRTFYQLVEARRQLDLLDQQIETNAKVLELIKVRFGSGQTQSVDIFRQKQLLEATREQKYAAESRIRVLEHQLAVLVGKPPRDGMAFNPIDLPDLPPVPDTGIPIELVRRRPDVRSAYLLVKAADRTMAAAISNRFPRLTLTASVSSDNEGASRLFEDWALALGGNIVAPLFDAGERAAEVDRTEAVKKQRLYQYGQTILTAFQEVENALVREKKQIQQIQSLESQVRLASRTYERLRFEYFNGVGDFIEVLLALTDEQQLRRDLLSARMRLLEFRIALYRALAGGFETGRETARK